MFTCPSPLIFLLLLLGILFVYFSCFVQFGDVHPGRSCRLRKPGDEYEDTRGLARTSSSGKATEGGGGFGSSSGDDGGQEGWSMFGWGDEDDGSDDGPWATKGRLWRDEDDDKARSEL